MSNWSCGGVEQLYFIERNGIPLRQTNLYEFLPDSKGKKMWYTSKAHAFNRASRLSRNVDTGCVNGEWVDINVRIEQTGEVLARFYRGKKL